MLDTETLKITVEVPKSFLEGAKKYTGEGTTGAVREGLRMLDRLQAQKELLKLKGTLKVGSPSIEEMRSWED